MGVGEFWHPTQSDALEKRLQARAVIPASADAILGGMSASSPKGQRPDGTNYTVRNVVSYAKVAFDADGDGHMDAWCQLPSDQVIEDWLKSGCERAESSRRK